MPKPFVGRRITCCNCSRATVLVPMPTGGTALVDPEVMTFVPPSGGAAVAGRRLHREMCDVYARDRKIKTGL